MGLFDSLFGSRKSTPEVSVIADPYKDVRDSVTKWLTQNLDNTNTYEGERVAQKTPQETQSLASLDAYANRKTPQTTEMARNELTKTLQGNYDPSTSPYYQAVKAEAARNLKQTQENIASNAAGGGRYWAGPRVQAQSDAATEQANNLNILLGELSNQERNRMLQAVPLAQSMGQDESNEPLNTTAALQQYGSLDRQLQQAAMDAMYEEGNTANRQYPLQVAGLASGVQQAPLYGEVTKSPSTFMKMLGEVAAPVGSYNTAKYGYTTNQRSLKQAVDELMKAVGGMAGGAGGLGSMSGGGVG
jgi:hypothetical protein